MAATMNWDEMIELGRQVYEGRRPGFETNYEGRVPAYKPPYEAVVSGVEIMAEHMFLQSDEEQFGRCVDDWCERFDKLVEENLNDGDQHSADRTAAT